MKFRKLPKNFGSYENPLLCKCGNEAVVNISSKDESFAFCYECSEKFYDANEKAPACTGAKTTTMNS